MIKLAPSILAADFSRLGEYVQAAEAVDATLVDISTCQWVQRIQIAAALVIAGRNAAYPAALLKPYKRE